MLHKFPIFILLCFSVWFLAGCNGGEKADPEAKSESMQTAGNQPAGEVEYTAPESWIKQEPSSHMRKAQYSLPGVNGADSAELAVFFFPGTGGSVQANLDRWYGQIKQPDGSSTADKAKSEKIEVGGLQVTVVHVTGTYLKSQSMMMAGPVEELPDYAMLAAIVETTNGPWFFKAVGPEKTIEHWRPSFDQFVRTFKIKSSS